MVTLKEVLALAKHLYGNQSDVARAVGRTRATVSTWYTGKSKPDLSACLELATVTGLPAKDVAEAAGHDPRLLSESAAKTDNEQRMINRQLALREQRDRWVLVLGPTMGSDAAEDYFWDAIKRHADTMLEYMHSARTAVNADTEGAVNAAVSGRAERGRKRRGPSGGPLTNASHPSHPVNEILDVGSIHANQRHAA